MTWESQIDALNDELLGVAEQLIGVLEAELAALRARDAGALAEIAERKQRLLAHLSALEASATGGDPQANLRLSDELKGRLADARRLNARNGRVIETANRFIRRSMDVLVGRNPDEGLYAASGERRSLVTNRYSSSA